MESDETVMNIKTLPFLNSLKFFPILLKVNIENMKNPKDNAANGSPNVTPLTTCEESL